MYSISEENEAQKVLAARAKELAGLLVSGLTPLEREVKIRAGQNLLHYRRGEQLVFYLRQGMLGYSRRSNILLVFEEGDFVGLGQIFSENALISSEFVTTVDVFRLEEILSAVQTDRQVCKAWSEYLLHLSICFSTLWAAAARGDRQFQPSVHQYTQNEVIIEQGADDKYVYTLVEGGADVFVDQVKVGEVQTDEIFGTFSALTGGTRTAQVVARVPSTVLCLPREEFIDLVKERPGGATKLIEDMIRTIIELNGRIVSRS